MFFKPTQIAGSVEQILARCAQHPRISLGLAFVLGCVLYIPVGESSLNAWREAAIAKEQLEIDEVELQQLTAQVENLEKTLQERQNNHNLLTSKTLGRALVDLQKLAHQQGLSVTHLSSTARDELNVPIKQQDVEIEVKGAWGQWKKWTDQFQMAVPNAWLSNLKMTSDQGQGALIRLHYLLPFEDLVRPQSWTLPNEEADSGVQPADPFNASAWKQTQAQNYSNPSAPSVLSSRRDPHPLEKVPLSAMTYLGQISKPNQLGAVVHVADTASASVKAIYTLRVGDYLGPHSGQVTDIHAHELVLREWVLDASGEWLSRTVTLPLHAKAL